MDPRSLATLGEETFGGTLPWYATFSAHPHVDRRRGALVSVGLGARVDRRGVFPVAETWEIGRDGRARRGASVRLRNADVIHSVGLTPRKTVVLLGPYGLDAGRLPELLARRRGLFDCVAWRPRDPLVVYVADRDGRTPPVMHELPAGFVIHVANAFECGQGSGHQVVVDAVVHADPMIVEAVRVPFTEPPSHAGRLVRTRIAAGAVTTEVLSDAGVEFPTVRPDLDGLPHRYVYAGCFERNGRAQPTSALLKIDTQAGKTASIDLGDGSIFGEPVFVPREGGASEDDGWVLSLGYDGNDHHSFLAILRADAWAEIARVHVPFHVPMGLHASFMAAR
jgi:carotenoid cleavage dioxygenase-like enzyme